jgi:uncharacterized peroxidase-related enzyme
VAKKFGHAPNITRLMANSPAALEGYLSFSGALANGKLDPQLREQIAITVANANGCNYCLSAHTAIGKLIGLTSEELTSAQSGQSAYDKPAAALRFASKLVRERGRVADNDVAELRRAGFDDTEIVEIVGTVALNIFTNYFNHVAETEIDFPLVKASAGD